MKLHRFLFAALASVLLFACHKEEVEISNGVGAQKMKQVTISTSMDSPSTRASLDSETGAFSWQSGDLISVLATDGNFYDFILESGAGNYKAEFVGYIPENAYVTTVATYPRIVSNGSANTVLVGSTLSYNLPATWTYAKDVSNVPMVAAFSENATHMAFKQVGGVMRFPVKNMPTEAKFIITMEDKTITGAFPVDINNLGTSAMTAGSSASELVINYSSEIDGAYAEFNVPVPTGTYNNFTLTIKDANDKVLFTKEYTSDINEVERATLLNMKEIILPERPMTIAEVWPFFVDARVVFSKVADVTEYAFYIDGAETPVIIPAEELNNGMYGGLIGGQFAHNSTHTVAIAKVVDSTPVAESKSEAVEFTTGNIFQMTQNTGTKFVTAGWDDVAIGWGPKYDFVKKQWSVVPKSRNTDNVSVHYKRGYQVQLLAADKQTVIYDMIPFSGHEAFTGAFSDSSWLGKVANENILIPTALAFGYLEPGKDYYFRVKTLDGAVNIGPDMDNHNPEDGGKYPVPYPIFSERGGCAWSEPVKLTTNATHVASENEIFYEGFDDIMFTNDYMNWAPAVVPDLNQTRISWDAYAGSDTSVGELYTLFPEFMKSTTTQTKWTAEAFSAQLRAHQLGLVDNYYLDGNYPKETKIYFNEAAGSLEGWAVSSDSFKRTIYPIFGAVRIGQSGSGTSGSTQLYTPIINSDKLLSNTATKCIITANIGYASTAADGKNPIAELQISRYSNNIKIGEPIGLSVKNIYPEEYQELIINTHTGGKTDYANHQRYYEVKCEMYLKNGDILSFARAGGSTAGIGMLILGDVKIEVVPGEYEQITFFDDGIGTEPDNTNYDIFGLGEFPVSYFYGPPTAWYTKIDETTGRSYYDYDLTKQTYQDVKDAGFNIAIYNGENDYSITENKRLLDICTELGLKFIGQVGGYATHSERIDAIKANLATSDNYLGEYLADEPHASRFGDLGAFTSEFLTKIPNKEVYINLFPMYAKASQTGNTTYEAHIVEYLNKVPTKSLSFDYYALNAQNDIDHKYYTNLDLVRDKTLGNKMPFWVITQAGPINTGTIDPNEEQQRWSVWSNIALGSKGISYFTYWTPIPEANLGPVGFMVLRDGTKRDIYYWIKQINADIKTIGKKLLPCHADGAIVSRISYHYMWSNGGIGRTKYGPIQKVGSGLNNYQVLCGCFRDARTSENGENYKGYKALVMSQIPNRDVQALLTLDSAITKITVTHNNTSQEVTISAGMNVTVGDITLSYVNDQLAVNIPNGEAALIEF